jgi:hypothetical protein
MVETLKAGKQVGMTFDNITVSLEPTFQVKPVGRALRKEEEAAEERQRVVKSLQRKKGDEVDEA